MSGGGKNGNLTERTHAQRKSPVKLSQALASREEIGEFRHGGQVQSAVYKPNRAYFCSFATMENIPASHTNLHSGTCKKLTIMMPSGHFHRDSLSNKV